MELSNDHHPSPYIYTTYLGISDITIMHDNDDVWLSGCFGNMLSGRADYINLHTNFTIFKELLEIFEADADANAQIIMDMVAEAIVKKEDAYASLDISLLGGLCFEDYIFAFTILEKAEENGYTENNNEEENDENEPCYYLTGFRKRKNFLPPYMDMQFPLSKEVQQDLLSRLAAVRYLFYLDLCQLQPEPTARYYSGMSDHLLFALSQFHFQAMQDDFNETNEEE